MPEALHRQWVMFQAIPREPLKRSTSEIWRRVQDAGYKISKRSIERDLASSGFGYASETHGKTTFWFWPKDAAGFDIPGMDPAMALVMSLAREQLTPLLPAQALQLIEPYFRRARDALAAQEGNALANWRKRVRVISRGPVQKQPVIHPDVQRAVYEAILHRRTLKAAYRKRGERKAREYVLNPQALVLREGVMYLVATAWEFREPLQFVLHRFTSAKVGDDPAKPLAGFDVDAYIEKERAFSYPVANKPLRFVALFNKEVADHVLERPLSDDQEAQEQPDGRIRVTATVADTADLRWWILGFGSRVEVVGPSTLRKELAAYATELADLYAR